MSTLPDNELDLEKLFLPAWAQEPSSTKYAHYEGEVERPDRRGDRRGPRPPRRDGPPGPRRDDRRPGGGGGENRGAPRGDSRGGPRPEGARGRPGGGGDRPFGRRNDQRDQMPRREAPPPLPEINLALIPDEKGVESLARQIKMTGRAYPLFDIAQMILQKPERHTVVFSIKKNAQGQPVQPLLVCALDDTLWLSEAEAVEHILRKHFATFYQAERTATEPPKGKYTFVAQCGLSGVILGPPNHHDYQTQLRKLHADRFSRMDFEVFKSRVRIVRDEEVVKKWIDDQSWKTEYICLNLPEPLRLGSMEAVTQHFRETHKENIIKAVETHTLNGAAARALRCAELVRLVRNVWEDQRRFPLQIATVLSQQFAGHGLQFFKVNKAITHVSIARPHYLDLAAAPVSEGIKHIVEFIDLHPRATRRDLVEALAPTPLVSARVPAAAPIPVAPAQPAEVAPATGEAPAAAQPAPAPAPAAEANQPTPEQTLVIADLHWLIHQGHVIEFANGILETAKKPVVKPPRPEPRPVVKPAAPAAQAAPAVEAAPVAGEVTGTETPAAASEPATPAPAAPVAEVTPVETPVAAVEPAPVLQEAVVTPAAPAPVAEAPAAPPPTPAPESPAPSSI